MKLAAEAALPGEAAEQQQQRTAVGPAMQPSARPGNVTG